MKKVIGLLWHGFDSPNLGVSALSYANSKLIFEAIVGEFDVEFDVEFVVFGYKPLSLENAGKHFLDLGASFRVYEFGLRSLPRTGVECAKELRKCDVVFDIGEGDSFSDIYGLGRLANQVSTKLLAKILCGKLVLSPQTIGPFSSKIGRAALASVVRIADAISTRDEASKDLISRLCRDEKVSSFSDVAFSLPFCRQPMLEKNIGINVSGLLYNGGYKKNNDFNLALDYKEFTHRLVYQFLELGCVVHLVSHVSRGLEVEDDYLAASEIKNQFPEVVLSPRFSCPVEVKSYISQLEFFVGARMHAAIAAFSAGVPVVPIAYSKKFSGVFGEVGYDYTVDARSVGVDDALERVVSVYEDKEEAARVLTSSAGRVKKNIERYREFLKGELSV